MITLTEAQRLQDERKTQAIELLKHFRFENLFNEYGEYVIRGSFAHNLMLKPDIDGTIYVQKTDLDAIVQLVGRLIRMPGIETVAIDNRSLINDNSENKQGYTVRLKVPFQGTTWNLDVLIMQPEDAAGHDYLGEHHYSPEQHAAMLLVKAQLTEMRRYPGSSKIPGSFASIDVYRAVIEDGVRTTQEMLTWGERHDYYGKVMAKS